MKLSTLILDRIITDLTFSRDLSAVLQVRQDSVINLANKVKRDKSPGFSLTRAAAIAFYTEKGYKMNEIFESEPAAQP